MSFGEPSSKFHQWTLPEDETSAVVKRAFELGINFIDTANTYSFGTSEEYIGRASGIWHPTRRSGAGEQGVLQ